jgi:DNA-binding transcriptional regulator YbjK
LTPRGQGRRDRLVQAACAILGERGFDALGHRAVAGRAGLPLAATTYYFATLDDLIEAAAQAFGEPLMREARALAADLPPPPQPPDVVARLIVTLVVGDAERADPVRLLTFYERYVQAGRHPRLRPLVRGWTDELVRLSVIVLERFGYAPPDELAAQFVALTDGLLLGALIDGDEDAPAQATASVARLLTRLQPVTPPA